MPELKVDAIVNLAGSGKPNLPVAPTVGSSAAISTLNTHSYTSSGSEPGSPKNGALWWDSGNDKVFVYIDSEFKEIALNSPVPSAFTWGGDRHVFHIGYDSSYSNKIEYQSITTAGNAADFGDTLGSTFNGAACGNGSRGVFSAGWGAGSNSETNVMEYITTSTTGNATDFGDLTAVKKQVMATSDGTRGLIAGGVGASSANLDVIEYITIANTGNATDFGDLSSATIKWGSAFNDATRSVINDGASDAATAIMEYVTTQTAGNATDFGDHLNGEQHGACSDATRGLICGGETAAAGTRTNVISYVTTQTAANSADFGDLTMARSRCGAASDGTYATIVGGRPASGSLNGTIDKVTVQTAANATDYGDMATSDGQYIESVSGAAS